MARPKVDRIARSVRLPRELDAKLVAMAETRVLSVNEMLAEIVRDAPTVSIRISEPETDVPRKDIVIAADGPGTPTRIVRDRPREVSPRWKAGMKP